MNTHEHDTTDQPVETGTTTDCPACAERRERRAAREELWCEHEGRGAGRRRGPRGERPDADDPRPPFGPEAGFGPHPHGHGCGPHGPHSHGRRGFGRKIRRAYERGFAAGFAQGRTARDTQATPAE